MSLVLQYNFSSSNVSNNTILNNISGIYDATMINNPIQNSPGPNECTPSMEFNGVYSQYITLPATQTTDNGMSFAFWYYADSSNNNTWSRIFDFSNGSDSDNILAGFSGGGFGFGLYLGEGQSAAFQPVGLMANGCFGQWNHVVWTISYPQGWTFYFNGVLYTEYSSGPYPYSITRSMCYLGKSPWDNPYFTGSIADFRFYDSTITQSTVTSIYQAKNCIPLNLYPLINDVNDLYNPIYCTNLVPTNNNFITCQNCNFGSGNVTNTSTQSGEQNCLNACNSDKMCTSYSYNLSESTNNCTQYSSFPTEIIAGVSNINSGYSLNFGYDYNSLSASQQENVQTKCANQYLNNTFLQNNNIDMESCITVDNSTNPTNFNVDPQCLFNVYKTHNLNPTVINTSTYNDLPSYLNPTTDSTINNYEYNYDNYIIGQIQKSNLSNKLEKKWSEKSSNKEFEQTLYNQNEALNQDYLDSIQGAIKKDMKYVKNVVDTISNNFDMIESFNNDNKKKSNVLMLIFIIMLVIFLYYILRKIK